MSSRIFKRSAKAFRAPRIARQRMLPPPEYPRIPNRDRVAESPQMKHLKRRVQRWSRPLSSYHEYMVPPMIIDLRVILSSSGNCMA